MIRGSRVIGCDQEERRILGLGVRRWKKKHPKRIREDHTTRSQPHVHFNPLSFAPTPPSWLGSLSLSSQPISVRALVERRSGFFLQRNDEWWNKLDRMTSINPQNLPSSESDRGKEERDELQRRYLTLISTTNSYHACMWNQSPQEESNSKSMGWNFRGYSNPDEMMRRTYSIFVAGPNAEFKNFPAKKRNSVTLWDTIPAYAGVSLTPQFP